MPATPMQGRLDANILTAEFIALKVGISGQPFATATEAINIGLRDASKITIKPVTSKTATETEKINMYAVDAELISLQASIAMLKNAYILGQAPVQAVLKIPGFKFLNFVDNPSADPTAATGSQKLGLTWKYNHGQSKRSLSFKLVAELLQTEYEWMLGAVATSVTGGAGIKTGDLTANAYDEAKYTIPGYEDITVDGVSVGFFKDADLTLESMASGIYNRKQVANRKVKVTGSFTMLQTTALDLLGLSQTAATNKKTVIMKTSLNELYTFNPGSVSLVGEADMGDKENMVKVKIAGTVINNEDDTTPTTFDPGTTTPLTVALSQTSY